MTSIRRQLTRKLLAAVAIPVIAGSAVAFAVMRDEAIEQFDAALRAKAAAVAGLAHVGPGGDVELDPLPPALHEFLAIAGSAAAIEDENEGHAYFQIRSESGRSIVRSALLGTDDLPFPSSPANESLIWNMTLPHGESGRAVAISLAAPADPGQKPRFFVVVAGARRGLDDAIWSLALVLGATCLLVLAAAWLVVPYVVRREFAPVDAFANEASRIGAESLSSRFSTGTLPQELEPIGVRLNDLLSRLETSFARERQFSADLAHELRTPIAELRSLAELALKWPESRPADADRDVLAIAQQMEGLVTRLLAMHRSEQSQLPVTLQSVDLSGLLRDAWKPYEERARARVLNVGWNGANRAEVVTDPVLLQSTLANLLQNAVEYTPEGGGLFVDTEVGATGAFTVRVRNTTAGVTPEQVTRFFDRFFRADASRSPGDHVGLGLPLARAFARALGGDVTAALNGQQELELTLRCPARS